MAVGHRASKTARDLLSRSANFLRRIQLHKSVQEEVIHRLFDRILEAKTNDRTVKHFIGAFDVGAVLNRLRSFRTTVRCDENEQPSVREMARTTEGPARSDLTHALRTGA